MDNTIFAQRLKEARIASKLTQIELSKMSGVTPATISAYECADGSKGKNPSLDNALKLAQALNVSLDWLCGSIVSNPKIQITDFLKLLVRIDEIITSPAVDKVDFADYDNRNNLSNAFKLIDDADWELARQEAEYRGKNFSYNLYTLTFNNYFINKFLREWANMRFLYKSKTIDESLYNLWLEKQFEEIDLAQKRNEEMSEEILNYGIEVDDLDDLDD